MKAVFVASICLMLMVGTGFSAGPGGPTPPGGWGTDCTQWIHYYDPWDSGEMCYDPVLGAGGDGWRVCSSGLPVVWPALNIEMWIEMECVIYFDAARVEIHRASDYGAFYIYFYGGSRCNHGQYIITTPPTAVGSLDNLPFVSGVVGSYNATYDVDIPLTWEVSVNGGAYVPMTDDPSDGSKHFIVDACDQYWCVRVLVDPIYHQGDGYYWLGGDGCYICPAEPL